MSAPIRILLCDDEAMTRTRVRAVVDRTADFQVVGEAGNGAESVALSIAVVPDLVLMDVSMPDLSGIEATRQILEHLPDARVLAFSSDSRKQTANRMISAGACGYVVKSGKLEALLRAIRIVAAGGRYLDPDIK